MFLGERICQNLDSVIDGSSATYKGFKRKVYDFFCVAKEMIYGLFSELMMKACKSNRKIIIIKIDKDIN